MRLEIESDIATPHVAQYRSEENKLESDHAELGRCLKQGISAARSGDRALARTLLIRVTDADPRNADAWLWLASISEYPEELLGFLDNVLEIDPENDRASQWKTATRSLLAKTYVERGRIAIDEQRTEFAEQCFEMAIGNDEKCEMAWFWKASLANHESERIEYLERVLAINPKNAEAQKDLTAIIDGRNMAKFVEAQTAAVKGDWKMAEELVDDLLESDLSHLGAWMLRSQISLSLEEKLLAFDRILEIDPKNSYARFGHDFLKQTFETARPPKFEEQASSEVGEFDQNHPTEDPEAEVECPVELYHLAHDAEDSRESGDPAVAENADDVSIPFEAAGEAILANDESYIAPEPESIETTEAPKVSETFEAAPDDGDNGQYLNSDSMEYVEDHEMSAEIEETVHESFVDRYESVLADQSTDENLHEYLTQDSYRAPFEFSGEPAYEFDSGDANMAIVSDVPTEAVYQSEAAHGDSENGIHEFERSASSEETARKPGDDHQNAEYFVHQTVPDVSEYLEPVPSGEINTPLASYDLFESKVVDAAPFFDRVAYDPEKEPVVQSYVCPYCAGDNEPQAFTCRSCRAVLSISDIDSLLADFHSEREVIQQAVTQMEAEWNLREFNESELTALGIGHFNLNNYERGLAYLQEASRLNPNNVILAGQVNALAIRLEEMRRQDENREGMPKGKTILVVDDSATVRKLISSKLEKCGHNVLTAVDGVEAMEVLESVVPDLVLLDIAMPRMDGYSVCKLIRASDAVKNVPVVMISGKDGFFDKVRGRMAGTTGYVTKPFGPETLMHALETYLDPEETVDE